MRQQLASRTEVERSEDIKHVSSVLAFYGLNKICIHFGQQLEVLIDKKTFRQTDLGLQHYQLYHTW